MEPVKLRLIRKTDYVATVAEEGLNAVDERGGHIEIICSGPQAFAEIVQRLLESHLAVAAVQQAIHCLQMAKSTGDRVADLRMLQDVHHKLTGWHFDSAAKPVPIEGVEPSSGSVAMEKAREAFGELDPDKIAGMFPGLPGSKIRLVGPDENIPPFHPKVLEE